MTGSRGVFAGRGSRAPPPPRAVGASVAGPPRRCAGRTPAPGV